MSLIGPISKAASKTARLLTGSGPFLRPMSPHRNMLYMRVVRSSVAFGRLSGLRITEALAHPGTVCRGGLRKGTSPMFPRSAFA